MTVFGDITAAQNVDVNALVNPTPGATVSIDPTLGNVFAWSVGEAETVNAASVPSIPMRIILIISNVGIPRIVTFGTGFRYTGTITVNTGTTNIVTFQGDGTYFWNAGSVTAT